MMRPENFYLERKFKNSICTQQETKKMPLKQRKEKKFNLQKHISNRRATSATDQSKYGIE